MKSMLLCCMLASLLMAGLYGCEKKSDGATVIGKDHIAPLKQEQEVQDERATNHEHWIVKARMLNSGRMIEIRADQKQWEKLRANDRVKVIYQTGKYTGTVWGAEIREN